MTSFFAMSMVKRALEVVSKSDFGGKDIPAMHTKTINFLLNRGTCICGTQLMEGSLPYNNLVALMEYLPPQSIGVTVGGFVKDSRALYLRDTQLFEKMSGTLGAISEQDENIAEMTEQIELITSKLDGDDVREQVKKINAQIVQCTNLINARRTEQRKLLMRRGAAETEKKNKENSRSELSLLDKNNQHIERCKAYALRIYEDLCSEYQQREKEIRSKLERYINDIFKTIYDGGLSLSIDEKYNISVYVNDFEGGVETSTAQSISVIFAFISAIIKMARENRAENGDEAYSEPYPLVMDAPLSAFDKRRIEAICTAIPETAEQVIIFIKDTDGDLAEEHLGTKVKTRHHFIKLDEFNTKLD
jgi:DNA sulfur modification protein DndD